MVCVRPAKLHHRRVTRPLIETLDDRVLLSTVSTGPGARPVAGPQPTVTSTYHQFYVSPNGTPSGDGSIAHPWDLQTALNQPAAVKPGDEIWVRGGTYVGNFVSKLNGTSNAPIVVRQYAGEHAVLDGRTGTTTDLRVNGQYSTFWDLEFTDSDPQRVTTTSGSDQQRSNGVDNFGVGTKLINLVVHDTANGITDWTTYTGPSSSIIYGCLIYNCGWYAPDRGHGHAIYAQNWTGTKTISDNIMFDEFDIEVQIYGSSAAYLNNFTVSGNDVFNPGKLGSQGGTTALLIGGGSVANNPTVTGNTVYSTSSEALNLGYSAGVSNAVVKDNYLVGPVAIGAVRASFLSDPALGTAPSVSNNYWIGNVVKVNTPQDLTTGNTSMPAGTFPTDDRVYVRPNAYEPGRANITVFNWQKLSTVSVNVAAAGLAKGQTYQVYDSQNYTGGPILTGVFTGAPIDLPMTLTATTQPLGNAPLAAQHTDIRYGSFILMPGPANGSPGGPTAPPSPVTSAVQTAAVTPTAAATPVTSTPTLTQTAAPAGPTVSSAVRSQTTPATPITFLAVTPRKPVAVAAPTGARWPWLSF